MGELGQLLRQTREEKGLDLERVAHETRIRVRFLEALEQENYDELPTPGHVHGFLRNYALYLGLDLEEVQALYDTENTESRLFVPRIFRPKDISLAPRRPLARASLVLGVVLLLVGAVVGGWLVWQYGWPVVQPLLQLLTPAAERTAVSASETATAVMAAVTETPTLTATATATAVATQAAATATPALTPTSVAPPPDPTETPTPVPDPTRRPTRTPTRRPTRTPSPTPVEGVTLSIEVIERAWLQVTIDGEELPGELLEMGEERTWEAEQVIYFICGNAGGVEVTINGEALGVLGRRAEVLERTWTPQGEATPTPQPS